MQIKRITHKMVFVLLSLIANASEQALQKHSYTNLPSELLLQIFNETKTNDLISLLLTSKSFYEIITDEPRLLCKTQKNTINIVSDFSCLDKATIKVFLKIIYNLSNNHEVELFFNSIDYSKIRFYFYPNFLLCSNKHIYEYDTETKELFFVSSNKLRKDKYDKVFPDEYEIEHKNKQFLKNQTATQILEILYIMKTFYFFEKDEFADESSYVLTSQSKRKSSSENKILAQFASFIFFAKETIDHKIINRYHRLLFFSGSSLSPCGYAYIAILQEILKNIKIHSKDENFILTDRQCDILSRLFSLFVNIDPFRDEIYDSAGSNKAFTLISQIAFKENIFLSLLEFQKLLTKKPYLVTEQTKGVVQKTIQLYAQIFPIQALNQYKDIIKHFDENFQKKIYKKAIIGLFESYIRYPICYINYYLNQRHKQYTQEKDGGSVGVNFYFSGLDNTYTKNNILYTDLFFWDIFAKNILLKNKSVKGILKNIFNIFEKTNNNMNESMNCFLEQYSKILQNIEIPDCFSDHDMKSVIIYPEVRTIFKVYDPDAWIGKSPADYLNDIADKRQQVIDTIGVKKDIIFKNILLFMQRYKKGIAKENRIKKILRVVPKKITHQENMPIFSTTDFYTTVNNMRVIEENEYLLHLALFLDATARQSWINVPTKINYTSFKEYLEMTKETDTYNNNLYSYLKRQKLNEHNSFFDKYELAHEQQIVLLKSTYFHFVARNILSRIKKYNEDRTDFHTPRYEEGLFESMDRLGKLSYLDKWDRSGIYTSPEIPFISNVPVKFKNITEICSTDEELYRYSNCLIYKKPAKKKSNKTKAKLLSFMAPDTSILTPFTLPREITIDKKMYVTKKLKQDLFQKIHNSKYIIAFLKN